MTAHRPIDHRGAWTARDFASKDAIAFDLGPRHLAALEAALARVRAEGLGVDDITRESFPLPAIADDLAALVDEVTWGRGLVLVRGFPVARYDEDDLGLMFYGLGAHFGVAMSQSGLGDRLGRVVDVGGKDGRERAYRTSRELTPHTDACDIVGMLSVRCARSGGLSGYVSALAIYNEFVARHPEHLDVLCRGFPYHHFGEEPEGAPPVTPFDVPIFSWRDGHLSCAYLRAYMEMGVAELGRELTAAERAALDAFDAIACRPDMLYEVRLEPGEATFVNNYTVLHTRTGFEDHADPARKRLLFRLWLAVEGGRPLADSLRRYDRRRGIAKRAGGSTYYTGATPFVEIRRPRTGAG